MTIVENPFAALMSRPGDRQTSTVELSDHQRLAVDRVVDWLRSGKTQTFRLFGAAGTGKSTIAQAIGQRIGNVRFAAYTGKAALVMRGKGCEDATTLHGLIYIPVTDPKGRISYVLNEDSAARGASLVIIDECSMVDQRLGTDLLKLAPRVLVLGDADQLKPPEGAGYFTGQKPDFHLSEIHRQAADSPIIKLASEARLGKPLVKGRYAHSRVISAKQLNLQMVLGADQILVCRNTTRIHFNRRYRQLLGRHGQLPEAGDKLICLKNDRAKALLNGQIWFVEEVIGIDDANRVRLDLRPEDDTSNRRLKVKIHKAFFLGGEDKLEDPVLKQSDRFTFGYALTVHKAQGSQWNNVLLFDDSAAFKDRDDRRRLLYTGITRAADRITVVV